MFLDVIEECDFLTPQYVPENCVSSYYTLGVLYDEDINAGETKRFKFDFNETGTFELYCIVHKSSGMIGEIIVK